MSYYHHLIYPMLNISTITQTLLPRLINILLSCQKEANESGEKGFKLSVVKNLTNIQNIFSFHFKRPDGKLHHKLLASEFHGKTEKREEKKVGKGLETQKTLNHRKVGPSGKKNVERGHTRKQRQNSRTSTIYGEVETIRAIKYALYKYLILLLEAHELFKSFVLISLRRIYE
ncbi:CLUMA_CG020508, isoform A [Clunio marinus]|uniref:CLUMA_CG020508, isoform A n=1 Tax=Clunio marinus TaxID=568069 RepID=A0A1J1J577_9DIPT|nr:CLUMA_CG020508, isoform A [Clunio marinus]